MNRCNTYYVYYSLIISEQWGPLNSFHPKLGNFFKRMGLPSLFFDRFKQRYRIKTVDSAGFELVSLE